MKRNYLSDVQRIQEWFEKTGSMRLPSTIAKDIEEKDLGRRLVYIKQNVIQKYLSFESSEKIEKYRRKHPEIDEIIKIINDLESKCISRFLQNARKIKEWIEESGELKPPSPAAKDEEERKLGKALGSIRQNFIKQYLKLDEVEKEEYRKKHPETDEILEIVNKIDENKVYKYLAEVRAIQEWMEKKRYGKIS